LSERYGRGLGLVAWLTVAGLFGCGGSGVSSNGGGGISGTGVVAARGTITQFGSVFVNGTEFLIDGATRIRVNGQETDEMHLRLGMIVDVVGTDEGGLVTAATITYEGDLRGPVEAVDPAAGTLTVLGQVVDAGTARLTGIGALSELRVDDEVELSARRTSDGRWKATYLGLELVPGGAIDLKGKITGHDATTHTFLIGSQRVDYDRLAMMGHEEMRDSQEVRIHSSTGLVNGTLVADELTLDAGVVLPGEGDHMELEGFVTDVTSPTGFSVDGTPVDASKANFGNGTIALDVEVEVEGTIRNGMFVADSVNFEGD